MDPMNETNSVAARSWGARVGRAWMVAGITLALGALGAGCLTRPVTRQSPTTKTNFNSVQRTAAVDKVDLLFGIDNSASMGDKQVLLGEAVPQMITRLFTPNCVDDQGVANGQTADGTTGKCATGKPEFPPVHDMHIGIVSSSLGGRGSDACVKNDENTIFPTHNDDKGHLLNRAGAGETPLDDANPSAFLAWLPPVAANQGKTSPVKGLTDSATLSKDFADMVVGVHEHGCGYEAQLESVYRFLVQPDPYASITGGFNGADVGKSPSAALNGVDGDLLKQRKDFLRPDSLVAIIVITDENDSTVDPLAFGGRAWEFEQENAVLPGTSVCQTNPNDAKCLSCRLSGTQGDPACQKGVVDGQDSPNVRFFQMKRRFGTDPQFPTSRYVRGFSQDTVPNRDGEHPKNKDGSPSFDYVGSANCTNPLFAQNLPTDPNNADALCHATRGPRDSTLIFFAIIGGVPYQLLTDAAGNFKSSLSADDYQKIIGRDPLRYDFTGADPHMLESLGPRGGVGADDIHTNEWDTGNKDLQYACTFDFKTPKDCNDPKYAAACDCDDATNATSKSPLCDSTKHSIQTKGKAYPTIRELSVARDLKDQGIVASICPKDPINATLPNGQSNPNYGYNPAVATIVDRLKSALGNTCVPQPLQADETGHVPCLILEELLLPGAKCDPNKGLVDADPAIVAKYKEQRQQDLGGADAGVDLANVTVCQATQLTGNQLQNQTCDYPGAPPGWCYVTGKAAGGTCTQALKFSEAGNPVGARVSLQCIEQAAIPSDSDGG